MIGKFSLPMIRRLPEPDGLRYGGLVTWISGLTFAVSEAGYYLAGRPIISAGTLVTLDAADAVHSRIDVIAVDSLGNVVVIKGAPAADPQKPSIDTTSQIELTFVLVPANALEPIGISGDVVFNENMEWAAAAFGVVVNFNSANNPFSGAKCADVGAIGTGDSLLFTAGANKKFADYETLSYACKVKEALSKQHYLQIEFMLNEVPVSNLVTVQTMTLLTGEWEVKVVSFSSFQFTGTEFNAVRLKWSKSGQQVDHAGFYLDMVKLEQGIQQPPALDDTYVTALTYVEATHELVLSQSNNRPDIITTIPVIAGADGKDGVDGSAGFLVTKKAVLTSQIDGVALEFTLPETPAPKSVLVFLNGVQQFEHQVTVAGDIVTFVTAPKVGYHLDVLYAVTLDATLFADTPPEAPDGLRTLFSLSSVQTPGTLRVWLNGVRQNPATITEGSGSFEFAVAPKTGYKIRCYYEIEEQAKTFGEVPAGAVDGVNKIFTLTKAAIVAAVYLNGVYQHAHQVTVDGDTLTFANAPGVGYVLFADYSHL